MRVTDQVLTDSAPQQVERMAAFLVFGHDERTPELQSRGHARVKSVGEFEGWQALQPMLPVDSIDKPNAEEPVEHGSRKLQPGRRPLRHHGSQADSSIPGNGLSTASR
jgi:hypothetical protein